MIIKKTVVLIVLIIILSGFFLLNAFQKEIKICENGRLLSVSPDSEHLVFFSSKESDVWSDFSEGLIYIYDLKKKRMDLLFKEKCTFEFIKTQWYDSTNLFLKKKGKIFQINIKNMMKKMIFEVPDDKLLYDFAVSEDGKQMLYDVLEDSNSKAYQIVYLLNLRNKQEEEIYRIFDPRMGGGFDINYVFFEEDRERVYIINILRDLLSISLSDKTQRTIDSKININASQVIFSNQFIFYAKEKEIVAYSLKNGERFSAIKSDEEPLKVDYIGMGEKSNIYFSISDIVILYDMNDKKSIKIELPVLGPIVYCNDKIAIQSVKVKERQFSKYKLLLYYR